MKKILVSILSTLIFNTGYTQTNQNQVNHSKRFVEFINSFKKTAATEIYGAQNEKYIYLNLKKVLKT
jgi:hypothetical protein